MFGKKENSEVSTINPKSMNQLSPTTAIRGELVSESDIRIDGKITGNVTTKSKLVLGAQGVIEGNVICQNAYIEGKISGNIETAELLILAKTAVINGDLNLKKLVVEEGAKFNGKCSMSTPTVLNQPKQ